MTEQHSIDDIAMLLMKYPGVSGARGFKSYGDGKVWLHFRCSDFPSLEAIASCAVAANVLVTVGSPQARLCYESSDATGLPFNVNIDDDDEWPSTCEIFGVFLARNLKSSGMLHAGLADQLQRNWNAHPI